MAQRYSVGFDRAADVTSGGAYAEMVAGATKPISIRAVRVTNSSHAGGHISLVRSFAVGTGAPSGTYTGTSHRTLGATSEARAYAAWTQTPTGYISKIRDDVMPQATGSSNELWREDDGPLVLEPNTSILIINQGSGIAGGGLHVNFTWEEGPSSDR
jgi:hypothetical protein